MTIGRVFGLGLLLASSSSIIAHADEGQVLQIVVSIKQQKLNVYNGDQVVASSKVSTGKPGHSTPHGIFSILEKQKFHRSNLYSSAPMPWMQRITWSGVALHESNHVPNYPASHGCVRMPSKFARALYKLTSRGAHVVIANDMLTPEEISSTALFMPRPDASNPNFMADVAMRPALETDGKAGVEVAMNDIKETPIVLDDGKDRKPIYILITRANHTTDIHDIQSALNEAGYGAGPEDGFMGKLTRAAIKKFKADNSLPAKGPLINDDFIAALYGKTNRPLPQNGVLLVRQNFKEIYQAPVTIKDPEKALGTHFFEARDVVPETRSAQWYSMTLQNHLPNGAQKRLGINGDIEPSGTSLEALDRIEVPPEARDKIETLLADGSSMTITDVENGTETGLGTNFITITHPEPTG